MSVWIGDGVGKKHFTNPLVGPFHCKNTVMCANGIGANVAVTTTTTLWQYAMPKRVPKSLCLTTVMPAFTEMTPLRSSFSRTSGARDVRIL